MNRLPEPSAPGLRGDDRGEPRAPHPGWNGEQELGRESWAGSGVLVSGWLMFSAEEFTLQDANLPRVSLNGTFRDTLGKLNPRTGGRFSLFYTDLAGARGGADGGLCWGSCLPTPAGPGPSALRHHLLCLPLTGFLLSKSVFSKTAETKLN